MLDVAKVGVDDFLAAGGSLAVLQSAVVPFERWNALRVTEPTVELLDEAPPILARPLGLVEGRAYVATWAWLKRTTGETNETQRQLLVIRNDGVVFGPGMDRPLDELGLDLKLPSPARDAKLLSARGVKAYRAGARPDPRDVFRRLTSVINRFMSFDRSLATQETMAAFVACYTLATWFLDAFSVASFLWPNGSYGSGKTKLGILVCELAYLGEVILSGSTYASLRDLADMGATLMFDDAEGLADPRRTDPDKRSLLLAGNRKGAVIVVKEVDSKGQWRPRFVNAYCPRIFTATRLPDPVLASRTIVVPLVRTAEKSRANAEVLDYSLWPCDQRQLLDDLWALALTNLAGMPAHEAAVNQDAPLVGRTLEPWRPVLAVAHWLEGQGETGLYKRMTDLAKAYQTERVELEAVDHTRLVVRALVEVVKKTAPFAPLAPFAKAGGPFEVSASEVTQRANALAMEEDLSDEEKPFTNERRMGKVLSTLRLKLVEKHRQAGQGRTRSVSLGEVDAIARAYGMPPILPDEAERTECTEQTERRNGHHADHSLAKEQAETELHALLDAQVPA